MKKFFSIFIVMLSLLCLPLCGCTKDPNSAYKDRKTNETDYLVCYFSVTNNTAEVAKIIADELDADIVRIVPSVAYPTKYSELSDIAREERASDARPSIKSSVGSTEGYEYVFIGFPVWFEDIPNIIKTFAASNTFSGKTIVPFCTSESGGNGQSFSSLRSLYSDNSFENGLEVLSSNINDEETILSIKSWADSFKKLA